MRNIIQAIFDLIEIKSPSKQARDKENAKLGVLTEAEAGAIHAGGTITTSMLSDDMAMPGVHIKRIGEAIEIIQPSLPGESIERVYNILQMWIYLVRQRSVKIERLGPSSHDYEISAGDISITVLHKAHTTTSNYGIATAHEMLYETIRAEEQRRHTVKDQRYFDRLRKIVKNVEKKNG